MTDKGRFLLMDTLGAAAFILCVAPSLLDVQLPQPFGRIVFYAGLVTFMALGILSNRLKARMKRDESRRLREEYRRAMISQ